MQGRRLSSPILCTASTYFLTYTHPTKRAYKSTTRGYHYSARTIGGHTRTYITPTEGGYPTACSLLVCLSLPRGDIQSLTARALWSLWRTYTALPAGKCYLPQPDTCQVPRLDSAITADTQDIHNAQGRGTRALLLRLPIPRAICSEYPSCLSGLLSAGGATVLQRVALLRTLS